MTEIKPYLPTIAFAILTMACFIGALITDSAHVAIMCFPSFLCTLAAHDEMNKTKNND